MTAKAKPKSEQKPQALYVKVLYLEDQGPDGAGVHEDTGLPSLEALVGPRARVELERRTGKQFTEAIELEEHVYYVAWAAVYYGGLEPEGDFDTWLNRIYDAGLAHGEPPTPTRRAPKPAPSAS